MSDERVDQIRELLLQARVLVSGIRADPVALDDEQTVQELWSVLRSDIVALEYLRDYFDKRYDTLLANRLQLDFPGRT